MDDNSLFDENVYPENDDIETSEEKSDEEDGGGQAQDNVDSGDEFDAEYALNSIEDFAKINPKEITR